MFLIPIFLLIAVVALVVVFRRTDSQGLVAEQDAVGPPYAPSASQLKWFWLAGPLTLLIHVPVFAGVFGAPAMPFGMIAAWFMLRRGKDDYLTVGLAGFAVGVITLLIARVFMGGNEWQIFYFGLGFGPLMAVTFRAIAGTWRTV